MMPGLSRPSMAVVTVCTPGRAEHLRSQRRALAEHLPDARHVVVLPERPGSAELAAELTADGAVTLEVPAGADLPVARCRNLGGDRAAELGELIIFLDVDCMPGPDLGPRYAGRAASGSPATGSLKVHLDQQAKLVDEALGV